MRIYNKGYTHAGVFHADDVFSTALLKLVNPEFTVTRVFHAPDENDAIIYDIGGGDFDHHQKNAPVRENCVPYAAFGLLWKEYGAMITGSEKIRERLDEAFVSKLDDTDNGGSENPLSFAISAFNPAWDSTEDRNAAFDRSVDFAYDILTKLIEREQSVKKAETEVLESYGKMKNGIVILERFVPWSDTLAETDAVFVIYPSLRGGYNLQGVPVSTDSRDVKIPIPEAWRGRSAEELAHISGIKGLNFCHAGGFLATADSLEDAFKTAELILSMEGYE